MQTDNKPIDLGLIPIVVHDEASAKKAGEMVEALAIAALAARQPKNDAPAERS